MPKSVCILRGHPYGTGKHAALFVHLASNANFTTVPGPDQVRMMASSMSDSLSHLRAQGTSPNSETA